MTGFKFYCPADLPADVQFCINGPTTGLAEAIIRTVRPDVRFGSAGQPLVVDPALAVNPPAGAWVFPETATSYYDFLDFPISMVEAVEGRLGVRESRFIAFVAGMGGFFGQFENGVWRDETSRYRFADQWRAKPMIRAQVDALLGDNASRDDLDAVLDFTPRMMWRHWLSRLYNGMEYMDYITVKPGDVVFNCGVHGGGEIAMFLAAMCGQGTLINIDPLGGRYICPESLAAIGASCAVVHNVAAALHDSDGSIDLPVEPGGMAAGDAPGKVLEGMQTLTFRAATLDSIAVQMDIQRLDLVKMDIEGAEVAALDGAWATLRRFRPQLAISIYHQPAHFTDIALRIARELSDYRFFVRSYHFISNEAILYAIPRERSVRPRNDWLRVDLLAA